MSEIDIFVSSTSIVTLDHMNKLKNIAFVGNACHFDVEINFTTRQVCAESASDCKSTLRAHQMAPPGQPRTSQDEQRQ